MVQIGWAIHQVVAGKFPLSEVAGLPFVEDGFHRASLALYRLQKTGLLNNEYKDVVPLVFSVFGPSQLHFARQPRSIDDLSGLKIGVTGRAPSQLVGALGGTPISMQPGEFYEALQRRTIDAAITSWSAFAPYKLHEVTTYHVETLLGQGTSMFFMAKKKFDALPESARKILAANSDEATTIGIQQAFRQSMARLAKACCRLPTSRRSCSFLPSRPRSGAPRPSRCCRNGPRAAPTASRRWRNIANFTSRRTRNPDGARLSDGAALQRVFLLACRNIRFRQAEFPLDDVRAAHHRDHLVIGVRAAHALAAEAAIG